jgi:hypothetical protein
VFISRLGARPPCMLPDAPLPNPSTSHDACTTLRSPQPHARGPFHMGILFR